MVPSLAFLHHPHVPQSRQNSREPKPAGASSSPLAAFPLAGAAKRCPVQRRRSQRCFSGTSCPAAGERCRMGPWVHPCLPAQPESPPWWSTSCGLMALKQVAKANGNNVEAQSSHAICSVFKTTGAAVCTQISHRTPFLQENICPVGHLYVRTYGKLELGKESSVVSPRERNMQFLLPRKIDVFPRETLGKKGKTVVLTWQIHAGFLRHFKLQIYEILLGENIFFCFPCY